MVGGSLVVVDAENTTDSTLHVTEQITVQNGMLRKDANDPGSLSTDKAKTAMAGNRYILKHIRPGKRTVVMDTLEWFDPRDVLMEHAKAEVAVATRHFDPASQACPVKLSAPVPLGQCHG